MVKLSSEKLEQAKISLRKLRDEIIGEITDKEKKKELSEMVKEMSKDRWRTFTETPYITAGTPWK